MTQAPPNWYPDPQSPHQLRYWDGTQWSAHVAPIPNAQAPAMAPPPKSGLSGGATAGIVIAIVAGVLVVIGILAAIAIPVFLNQRQKAAEAGAQATLTEVANQIAVSQVDYPGIVPTVTAQGTDVVIYTDGAEYRTVTLPNNVLFGNFVARDADNWCVYVTADVGEGVDYQYSTWNGMEKGNCSA